MTNGFDHTLFWLLVPPIIVISLLMARLNHWQMLRYKQELRRLIAKQARPIPLERWLYHRPPQLSEMLSFTALIYCFIVGTIVRPGPSFFLLAALYVLSFVILLVTRMTSKATTAKVNASEELLREYLETRDQEALETLAEACLHRRNFDYNRVGIDALIQWGSPRAASLLQENTLSFDGELVSKAQQAAREMHQQMNKIETDRWEGIGPLMKAHVYWDEIGEELGRKKPLRLVTTLLTDQKVPKWIRDFVGVHQSQRKLEGLGYCPDDRVRAVAFQEGFHLFLRCPVCHKLSILVGPVREVHGVLDEGPERFELEDGQLTLNLWDVDRRQLHFAQTDYITVHPMANLDWALSALLEACHNAAHALPEIKLANGVTLQTNTQQLFSDYQHAFRNQADGSPDQRQFATEA